MRGSCRRGFITVIEVMNLLLVVAIVATVSPSRHRNIRPQAIKKACVSNMKTIEGAVELYLMEKKPPAGSRIDLEFLKAEGYLKTNPTCARNGRYSIRVSSPSGDIVERVEIRCDLHQGIDDTTSGL